MLGLLLADNLLRGKRSREMEALQAKEKERLLNTVKEEPLTIWTEDFKPTGKPVTFEADSYTEWMKSVLGEKLMEVVHSGNKLEVGDMQFWGNRFDLITYKWPCLRRHALQMGPKRGWALWNKPITIPVLTRGGTTWMSLTPMEVLTQRPGLRKARGKVLIGGLGLGWLAKRCCERKQVKEVTVAEINPHVAKVFGFNHQKLKEIVVTDVWKLNPEDYDSILLDIWSSYGDASYNSNLKNWKVINKRVWAWGDLSDSTLGG